MKKGGIRSGLLRAARVLAGVGLLAAGVAVAQVQSVVVEKNVNYYQTSPTRVDLDPSENPWNFNANVDGVNIGGIAAPIVTGPINVAVIGSAHNGGRLSYRTGDGGWRYGTSASGWGSETQATLDGLFGNGSYTFSLLGTSVTLGLTGNRYPVAPVLTLSGGYWSGDKYLIDTDRPLTITTNAFTGYGTHIDDAICIALFGPGFPMPFEDIAPFGCNGFAARKFARTDGGGNTLSVTIPANALRDGGEYLVGALFQAIVDEQPNPALPGSRNVAYYGSSTLLTVVAKAPVFPVATTVTQTPTTFSATSTVGFRAQDVGSQGSLYAFAMAPESLVRPAAGPIAPTRVGKAVGAGGKDTGVACVIAQLNANGQLQAANLASLSAAVTGLLSTAGSTVAVIPPGFTTANIAGTTFYVGYGASSAGMISTGLTRSAASVPGALKCEPGAPQTGWWWNPDESGRGFAIEVQGRNVFYAAFLYDADGHASWNIAAGPTSVDGSVYAGDLLRFNGGQTLTGPYRAPNPAQSVGSILLAFSTKETGTMVWPGGAVPIRRFDFNNFAAPTQAGVPESGWWWNPAESGRGFFIEWQNGIADMAGFMYDDAGNPLWYLMVENTPVARTLTGRWTRYANGQTLTSAYRPATQVNSNVGTGTIQFTSSTTATMTLPGGRTIPLERQRY